MSKFTTEFNGALVATQSRLPKGSQIIDVKVSADRRSITVEWENDGLQTNYFHPTVFPETNLEGDLPAGVRVKNPIVIVVPMSGPKPDSNFVVNSTTLPLKVDKKPSIGKTGKR